LHQIIGNLVSNSLKFSAGRPVRKVNLSISLSFDPPSSVHDRFHLPRRITPLTALPPIISSENTCLPPMSAKLPETAVEGQPCYIYVAVTDSGEHARMCESSCLVDG
jgi:signal transduction histidine kinase